MAIEHGEDFVGRYGGLPMPPAPLLPTGEAAGGAAGASGGTPVVPPPVTVVLNDWATPGRAAPLAPSFRKRRAAASLRRGGFLAPGSLPVP